MANQPQVKMSTRNIPGGKGGRCVRLTSYHHAVPLSRNLGSLNFSETSGPVQACYGSALPLTVHGRALQNPVNRRPIITDALFSNSDVPCGISGGYMALRKRFL